jgi:hypothetical protein
MGRNWREEWKCVWNKEGRRTGFGFLYLSQVHKRVQSTQTRDSPALIPHMCIDSYSQCNCVSQKTQNVKSLDYLYHCRHPRCPYLGCTPGRTLFLWPRLDFACNRSTLHNSLRHGLISLDNQLPISLSLLDSALPPRHHHRARRTFCETSSLLEFCLDRLLHSLWAGPSFLGISFIPN